MLKLILTLLLSTTAFAECYMCQQVDKKNPPRWYEIRNEVVNKKNKISRPKYRNRYIRIRENGQTNFITITERKNELEKTAKHKPLARK